jgi:hypothetical protein
MHISLLPTSTPPESAPHQALLENNLAWLRQELSGLRLPEHKAAVRHEIGVLEQLAGRDPTAVRDLLAAVNSLSHFKEPLERLIVLIERRRSFKNLPILLEHLCRTADSAEEMARAQLTYAWFAILHLRDDVRAHVAVLAALRAVPNDPAALLSLELLSRRLGDSAGLRQTLETRLAQTTDRKWGGVLALDLAQALAGAGDYAGANALLDVAIRADAELAFQALQLRVNWGRAAAQPEWAIDALTARATYILEALDTPALATRVPPSARTISHALDTWLQLARLEQEMGHGPAAFAALERARALQPADPTVTYALLQHAEESGQHIIIESIINAELAAGLPSKEAAALSVRLADSRIARNELTLALEALARALEVDPKCWVARAAQLDLLRGTRDAPGYALALEEVASIVDGASARSRYWLLAADVWARQADDAERACRALAAAESSGAAPTLVRRVERALAHASGNQVWYEAALRHLVEAGVSEQERAGLCLELWRSAILADAPAEADRWSDALEGLDDGRWIARLARAYMPSMPGRGADAGSCLSLAELEADPTRRAGLGWIAALRLSIANAPTDGRNVLSELHAQQPKHAAVAGSLCALLAGAPDAAARTAAVLRSTAGAIKEDAFAASLYLEAGLRSFRAGDHETAETDFQRAAGRGASCAQVFSAWLARLRPAGLGAAEGSDRLLNAIASAAQTGLPDASRLIELNSALQIQADENAGALTSAASLLSLLLGRDAALGTATSVMHRFAARDSDFCELADAWRYLDCIGQEKPSAELLEESTRRWALGKGGLPATLEWLAATQRMGLRREECAARRRLSELTSGSVAELCAASAALVAHISRAEPAAFIEGETPQLRLTNLDTSAPGCEPRRRARALREVGGLLGEGTEPMLSLLAGYNYLALGDAAAASASFRHYADAFPEDPSGWEGLLAAARSGGDTALLAEAAAGLGNTSREPQHAAHLFEEAAEIFFVKLQDRAAGQAALERAVELDIRRDSSFQRLLELYQERGDVPRLLELITRRLPVARSAREVLKLEWERARLLRQQGDTLGALAALDEVTARDANHLGALALRGEIYITAQRYAEAADHLARLATRADAPQEQRLVCGLAAVDLLEDKLDATTQALAVLANLQHAGLDSVGVRERLSRSAAKSGAWDEAVSALEQLMFERDTALGRAEAARLALAIHRDRRHDPGSAGRAAKVLLGILPGDEEALDLVLSGVLDQQLTLELLALGREVLVERLQDDPFQGQALQRLALLATRTGELQLRQTVLGALSSLGDSPPSARAELSVLDRTLNTSPAVAASPELLALLADPDDEGPIPILLSIVTPYLGRALGPTLDTLQVGRRERVSASTALPIYKEVSAWIGAFGLGSFELYTSTVLGERVTLLASDPIVVVVGADVSAPLPPFQRQELARAAYARTRGLGSLLALEENDITALVVAACKLGKVALDLPTYARQGEFERHLGRALPRKVRKLLPDLARAARDGQRGVAAGVRGVLGSLNRVAAIAVGDISVVLSEPGQPRSPGDGSSPLPCDATRRLLQFVLSSDFPTLRRRFGASVQ